MNDGPGAGVVPPPDPPPPDPPPPLAGTATVKVRVTSAVLPALSEMWMTTVCCAFDSPVNVIDRLLALTLAWLVRPWPSSLIVTAEVLMPVPPVVSA